MGNKQLSQTSEYFPYLLWIYIVCRIIRFSHSFLQGLFDYEVDSDEEWEEEEPGESLSHSEVSETHHHHKLTGGWVSTVTKAQNHSVVYWFTIGTISNVFVKAGTN